jgi:hypothetical protein
MDLAKRTFGVPRHTSIFLSVQNGSVSHSASYPTYAEIDFSEGKVAGVLS